jgi:hypothetical protein
MEVVEISLRGIMTEWIVVSMISLGIILAVIGCSCICVITRVYRAVGIIGIPTHARISVCLSLWIPERRILVRIGYRRRSTV